MIEKIKTWERPLPNNSAAVEIMGMDNESLFNKINELVDAVNKHEDIIRQIGEWGSSKGECLWCENLTKVSLDDCMIGCTTLDIPESHKTDPYAEQRKWIGCLCRFRDKDYKYDQWDYGLLQAVKKEETAHIWKTGCFKHNLGHWYDFCEPVKLDDDIIYKGGDK